MKTIINGFGAVLVTLSTGVFIVLIATALTGCGMMSSQGHFEMAGDQHGIRSMSDLLNGLANSRYEKNGYWKQRHLDTTEEGYNDRQPGFWDKVFFGGGLAAKQPMEEQ